MDSKEISYSKQKKRYAVISPSVRMAFIKKVLSKQATIKQAAQEFGIKFSTSKAILQTYRREGRVGKKKTRQRRIHHSPEKPAQEPAEKQQLQSIQTLDELQKPRPSIFELHKQSQAPQLLLPNCQQQQAIQMNTMLNQFYQSIYQNQHMTPSLVECMREIERQRMLNIQLWQMIQLNQQQQGRSAPQQFGLVKEQHQSQSQLLFPTPLQSEKHLEGDGRLTMKDLN